MVKGVTMAMVGGEPMLVFWRVEDFRAALDVSRETGLPITSPGSVAKEIEERIRRAIREYRSEPEEETP